MRRCGRRRWSARRSLARLSPFIGLTLLGFVTAHPRGARAQACNVTFTLTQRSVTPSGSPSARSPRRNPTSSVGDVVRWQVEIKVSPGQITPPGDRITVPAIEFDLDCFDDGGARCTDDGLADRYQGDGTITSTGCRDANGADVSFSTAFGEAGGDQPNEVIFLPSNPIVVVTADASTNPCRLQFDTRIQTLSGDSTPTSVETAGRIGSIPGASPATCNTDPPLTASAGGTSAVHVEKPKTSTTTSTTQTTTTSSSTSTLPPTTTTGASTTTTTSTSTTTSTTRSPTTSSSTSTLPPTTTTGASTTTTTSTSTTRPPTTTSSTTTRPPTSTTVNSTTTSTTPSTTTLPGASAGTVRFFAVAKSSFDLYTQNPTAAQQDWMRAHYWRMLTYAPYFDSRLSWFPDAWTYKDLYAIYTGSALAQQHPEWILRDASGNALYIRYACSGGTCPQYAGDVGNPAFRSNWIAAATATLAKGYRGPFVDDVNMRLAAVSNGFGQPVAPWDPRTGRVMAEADWRGYVAAFTEQIRAAFPDAEIVHNAIWFLGHDDPAIQRELLSADFINLERGVNDSGIRGGTGTYGFETFLAHIDWLHAQGRSVVFDAQASTDAAREYGLAAYFLVSSGRDGLGNGPGGTPGDWWPGYDVDLGPALGARYSWNGVIRRDFVDGAVLVNPPDAATQTLALETTYWDLSGQPQGTVTLGTAQGAVLRKQSPP